MAYVTNLQIITTKSIGCSNVKPARIKARAAAGSVTVCRGYDASEYEQHKAVAELLCAKFDWQYEQLIGGQDFNGDFQWVMLSQQR